MDVDADGLLIAIASRQGDRDTDDGLSARSLAENLRKRDQPIVAVFDAAARSVCDATGRAHCPVRYGKLSDDTLSSAVSRR